VRGSSYRGCSRLDNILLAGVLLSEHLGQSRYVQGKPAVPSEQPGVETEPKKLKASHSYCIFGG